MDAEKKVFILAKLVTIDQLKKINSIIKHIVMCKTNMQARSTYVHSCQVVLSWMDDLSGKFD